MKISPRVSAVVRSGSEQAELAQEEGSGEAAYRAARWSVALRCGSQRGAVRCGEESRPLSSGVPEVGDPATRDNAREVTVIRMAQLRSAFPVFQKRAFPARPRVSHL